VVQSVGPEFKPWYHKKKKKSWAMVAHACNLCYSGGFLFEVNQGNEFGRPYLEKNPSQKERAGGVTQGVGPEFKPSTINK
jgi:hypothetical protein